MSYPYEENMTQDMLDCMLDEQAIIAEYEMCFEKFKQASDAATINLPATAVTGEPVRHGARLVTLGVAEYWHDRMKLAFNQLPKEYVDELRRGGKV